MSGRTSCVILHDNSTKVSNMSEALLVFACVPKTLVTFLGDRGNMETNNIFIRNAKLWHVVCPIQNAKYTRYTIKVLTLFTV